MKKTSLRTQLSAGFMIIVLFAIALISLLSNVLIARQFSAYVAAQQKEFAESIAAGLSYPYDTETGQWNAEYIHGVGMYAMEDGYFIKVYDAAGRTVFDVENHDMAVCSSIREEVQQKMQHLGSKSGSFLKRQYPLMREGKQIGSAEISYYYPYFYNENAFRFFEALNRILLGVGVLSMAGAALSAFFLARRIAAPVRETAEAARQISAGNYAVRLEKKSGSAELCALTEAIDQMAETLEQQDALRRRLTTDIAHELRTPLSSLSAYLEAMEEGVWEATPERLRSCREELRRFTDLVGDLQKLSRAESENLQLHLQQVDLKELAETGAAAVSANLKAAGLTLRVEAEQASVCADRNRLQQVLQNLLSNAVKYSESGGEIVIRTGETEDTAFFSVTDQGIGIAEQDLPWIFERFYRTDASRSRKTGGTGVGLTISRAIVRAHHGEITAESRPGKGSCFTVKLPKQSPETIME